MDGLVGAPIEETTPSIYPEQANVDFTLSITEPPHLNYVATCQNVVVSAFFLFIILVKGYALHIALHTSWSCSVSCSWWFASP